MHTVLLKDFPLLIIMSYLAGKLTKKGSAGKMKAEVPGRVRKRLTERINLGALRLKISRNSTSCLKSFSERNCCCSLKLFPKFHSAETKGLVMLYFKDK